MDDDEIASMLHISQLGTFINIHRSTFENRERLKEIGWMRK